ncbi:hypothetical protein HWV62_14512 [Athelia sp. TMB]|nr:hypothetical protein HWV62_14512 [Athelia sp. TMB]
MAYIIPLPPSPSASSSHSPSPALESTTTLATAHTDQDTDPTSAPAAPTARASVTLLSSTAFLPIAMSSPISAPVSSVTPPAIPSRATPNADPSQIAPHDEHETEVGELPAFFSAVLGTSSPFSTTIPRSPTLTAVSSFSDAGSDSSARDNSPKAHFPARAQSRTQAQRAHVRAYTESISMGREGDIERGADSDDDTFGVLHSFNSSPRIRAARITRSLSTEGSDPSASSRSLSAEQEEFNFERSRSSNDELRPEASRPAVFARAPSASLLSPPFATPINECTQPLLIAEEQHEAPTQDVQDSTANSRPNEEIITIDTQSKQVHFLASERAPEGGHRVKLNPAPPASSLTLRLPSNLARAHALSSNGYKRTPLLALPPAPAPAIIQLPPTINAPASAGLELDHRTPNVYINGLPPNYPEASLYTLTCAFGAVRSVRTFTRHVGGRASYESVDAAEQCIEGLRNHHNLHPSFSKQMHKIPGTPYANVAKSVGSGGSMHSEGDYEPEQREDDWPQEDEEEKSFRVRMEKLQDPNSCNLYFEGLPLSIDEPTMAALVTPHSIRSSRFFQTKLSDPPRIIAFVRLETRQAAEDIIERLHGRMVRGWNEPGCRISVRFADSAEQRELRRTEKAKEGEPSPNRITIAQAALLNLRGQDFNPVPASTFQTRTHSPFHANCDDFKVRPRSGARYESPNVPFSSNAACYGPRAVDNAPCSPAYAHAQLMSNNQHASAGSHPDMAAIFASMQAGQALNDGNAIAAGQLAQIQARRRLQASMRQTRAPGGFTGLEEQILRAHGERQSPYQQFPQQSARSVGMHGPQGSYRPAGGAARIPETLARLRHQEGRESHAMADNSIREQARHVASQATSYQRPRHHKIDMPLEYKISPANDLHTPSAPSDFPYLHAHARSQGQQQISSASSTNHPQPSQAHLRSTTLPPSHFSQRPARSHQHNSSISVPSNNTNIEHISLSTRTLYNNAGNHNNFEHEHGNIATNTLFSRHNDSRQFDSSKRLNEQVRNQRNAHDPSETESPLVSPALTYGSARTPCTLSPSTPFFTSNFGYAQENYKGSYQEQFNGLEIGEEQEHAVRH